MKDSAWPDSESMAAYYLEQAILSDIEDDFEPEVQCKFCEREGLTWVHTSHGWRLSEPSGTIHTCKAYKKTPKGGPGLDQDIRSSS